MDDREALDRPGRNPWPVIIVGALAVLGAFTIVQWVFGFVFSLARLAIIVAIIAAVVIFFRGPPDK